MEVARKERMQEVVCYTVGDKNERLDLQRRRDIELPKLIFLLCWSFYSVKLSLLILKAFLLEL